MVAVLPVRDESQIWTPSTDDMYANRDVFQTPRVDGFAKTTLKTSYILTDPHADKNPNRPPMLGEESKQVNIGAYTSQMYSGQLSMRERAEMLVRLDTLYKGVIAALEKANNVEVVQSDLGDKALKFLLKK
jgi:hypothetical protein